VFGPRGMAGALSGKTRHCLSMGMMLLAGAVLAQGSARDYERAASVGKRLENGVFRDRVRPVWLKDGRAFWYRVRTGPETHEFVLVDTARGERRPAMDHGLLAKAMKAAGLGDVRSDGLPISYLEPSPNGGAFAFSSGGKGWRFDPAAGKLVEDPEAARPAGIQPETVAPDRTMWNGPETSLTVINRMAGEVELFWLDWGGKAISYGRITVGARRDQHTFAGHVWRVTGAKGEVLGTWVGREEPSTIEVTPSTRGERRERKPAEKEDRPGVSPNGRWRAFIQDDNVRMAHLRTGRTTILSRDGTADDGYRGEFHWSPDSRRLVAVRTRRGGDRKIHMVESSPEDGVQPRLHSHEYLKPGDPIPLDLPVLFDTVRMRRVSVDLPMCPTPWSNSDIRWAPDSSRFTFVYNQRGHQVVRVVAVDAVTGGAATIVEERSDTFIDYAGRYFLHFLDKTGELLWMSERDGWNHIYLVDSRTGRVKNQVTKGEWVVRKVERVDEDKRQVWFMAGGIRPGLDPYYLDLARVNLDGTGLAVLTEGDGTHEVEFSPDRGSFLDRWSRVDRPPVTEIRRSADGSRLCALESADARPLYATGWNAPERFAARGRDGATDIYGIIVKPLTFDPARKYPVIEDIYAGPQDSYVPKEFSVLTGSLELAELGFVVVRIDGMGTSNRSKKFHDVCWKNLGDSGFPDRIAWMKAAAETRPWMDLSRVGIFGGSAGGQSALRALLAHGDFYRAAVADSGCHDNRMDKIWWNELWMGWPVGPHYAEQSNVTQAHRLQGKLLLIVGELDDNVDPASTMQVVNALIKADKDFELVVVPGAGHGAGSGAYGERRMKDFFVRNLHGVEPRSSGVR